MRELKKEDFERGETKQAVKQEGKTPIHFWFDQDLLSWFKARARKNHRNYQVDMNQVLREFAEKTKVVEDGKLLTKAIREANEKGQR